MKIQYTIALFILLPILALIARNKIISSTFIVVWILLIPVCALYVVGWYKKGGRDDRMSIFERNMLKIPVLLLGTISSLIGSSILLWVAYVLFVEEQLQYTGLPALLGGLGGGAILIALGAYLIHSALSEKFTHKK